MKSNLIPVIHQSICVAALLIRELTEGQVRAVKKLVDILVKEIVKDVAAERDSTKNCENQNLVEGENNERQS